VVVRPVDGPLAFSVNPTDSEDSDEVDDEEEEGYDPADYSIDGDDGVKAFVTENPELAQDVLAAEQGGKDRSSLVKWLTEFIDNQTSGDPAAKNDSTEE
jgi:hypothetical protein